MLAENVKIVTKREANAHSVLVRKDLCKNLVQDAAVGKSDQVDKVRMCLITELQNCGPHIFKFSHLRAPLAVHPYERLSNHLPKVNNV